MWKTEIANGDVTYDYTSNKLVLWDSPVSEWERTVIVHADPDYTGYNWMAFEEARKEGRVFADKRREQHEEMVGQLKNPDWDCRLVLEDPELRAAFIEGRRRGAQYDETSLERSRAALQLFQSAPNSETRAAADIRAAQIRAKLGWA